MTLFADASALIAIAAGEPGADALADTMEAEETRLCSAISVWETVAGLCRSYRFAPAEAQAYVGRFISTGSLVFVGIGEREYELATDAFGRFGKGRHPAALNMGDCFAYACARSYRAKLLFKGDDFRRTDIEAAI